MLNPGNSAKPLKILPGGSRHEIVRQASKNRCHAQAIVMCRYRRRTGAQRAEHRTDVHKPFFTTKNENHEIFSCNFVKYYIA